MLVKAILLGLVSLVAVVDSRLIGRQNIGRPLILSTLAGLVLGDMKQGIILGASLELMSMGFVSIGAAGPPNMQLGSVIATYPFGCYYRRSSVTCYSCSSCR